MSMGNNRHPQWSSSQRTCLVEMGFRQWQLQSQPQPDSLVEAVEPLWLWPAVSAGGASPLVFILQTAEPAPAVRRLLSDMARHFGLALPGSPQPSHDGSGMGAEVVVGFADASPFIANQLTLPSLHALLSGDPEPRRQCWRQLSPIIARQSIGGRP